MRHLVAFIIKARLLRAKLDLQGQRNINAYETEIISKTSVICFLGEKYPIYPKHPQSKNNSHIWLLHDNTTYLYIDLQL